MAIALTLKGRGQPHSMTSPTLKGVRQLLLELLLMLKGLGLLHQDIILTLKVRIQLLRMTILMRKGAIQTQIHRRVTLRGVGQPPKILYPR